MPDVIIKEINHESTWKLRNEVLYPDGKLNEMGMDEDIEGTHFGVFEGDTLVAIISLFFDETSCQFRKFAVDASMQGKGVGRRLLTRITEYAISKGATILWCNARVSAIGFYIKAGFKHTGKFFAKNGFEYEILEKNL